MHNAPHLLPRLPRLPRRVRLAPLSLALVLAVLAGTDVPLPAPAASAVTDTLLSAEAAAAVADPVVTIAGDIAGGNRGDIATGALVQRIGPDYALTAGDNAYPDGTAADYQKYEQSWGQFKAKTRPAPGNHDYHTAAGSPPYYYTYFASQLPTQNAGQFYAFDVGGWRLYSLNCEISCSATSAQAAWLRNDLATAGAGKHKMAFLHRPRYSCGPTHGSSTTPRALWDALLGARADIVVAGHDHNYQRYPRMGSTGVAANAGMVSFVAGTGGEGLTSVTGTETAEACALAQFHQGSQLGVLKLTLGTTSFSWAFVATDDSVLDSGTQPTLDSFGSSTNTAPVVGAGPDRSITLPSTVSLAGVVSDDGLPSPPGQVTSTWSRVSGPGTVTFTDASSPTTTASFSVAGSYVLQLSATDGALTTSDQVAVTVAPAGGGGTPTTVDVPVRAGGDDAEENIGSGAVSLTSSDLELTTDGTTVQSVGMRFTNVTVPRGATITNAYVQFGVDEVSTGAASLSVAAQDVDNAPAFTTASRNVSSRTSTAARVSWTPASWPTVGLRGSDQRTPNLAPTLAQVIGRTGWTSGNAMALVVTGTGRRTADAFEGGAANAPSLHIEYTN